VSGEVSFQGADGNALRGRPGGGYVSTPDDGGASLAAARASLRNPDGSQWSASDNAIMAANLRDGVDKYRGTSRDAQGGGRDKYANMPIKMATAMRVADAQAASSRETTGMNNQVLRESQENQYKIARMPQELALANQRMVRELSAHQSIGGDPARLASALTSMGRGDLAKPFSDEADAVMGRAEKSRGLETGAWKDMQDQFKGKYINPDKNGNPEANSALESRAYARLKRTNPGAFKGNPDQRSQAISDAIADEELMQTFGNPQDGGFASLLPQFLSGNTLDDKTNEIPGNDQLAGARIGGKISGLRGALSPGGMEGGDRFLELPGGRQNLNLGKLSADAIARLQQHIDIANKSRTK